MIRWKKTVLVLCVAAGAVSIGIALSTNELSQSIVIAAPLEKVWNYVGDSTQAKNWSVFFDHITPLPGVKDGQMGSLRACFRRANETGPVWDERVVQVEKFKLREIYTFNVRGFRNELYNQAEYRVYQRFEELPEGRTRLTFASHLAKPITPYTLYLFFQEKDEAQRILKVNLENIAAAVESQTGGVPYQRPHPYEAQQRWD